MSPRVRQWIATIAAAIVLAYVGTVAVTEVQDYSWWSANLAWLTAFSVVCGALLALIGRNAVRSMTAASGLAVLIFVAVWYYTLWSFLGDYFSPLELMVSNLFILQVLPQSATIFGTTFFAGLLAIVAVMIFVPDHYRP
jgi:hypothetical protein